MDLFHNTYVLDAGANELLKLGPSGLVVRRTGGYGWQEGSMDRPRDLAASSGLDVYVADYGNQRILHFDRDLNLQSATASPGDPDAPGIPFGYPRSVAATRFGDLLVVDGENNRILFFARDGGEGKLFGDIHGGKGALVAPERIRVTGADQVFVQDSGRIVAYDIFGNYLRTYGKDLFPHLRTFAVDDKNLYVLDGCRIIKLDEGGSALAQIPLPQEGGGPKCEDIVDFQIRQGVITYLTGTRVWTAPFEEPRK